MSCTDYERHEQILDCRHPDAHPQVLLRLKDGCWGRLCRACADRIGIKRWPDVADRTEGSPAGIDMLQLAQAMLR